MNSSTSGVPINWPLTALGTIVFLVGTALIASTIEQNAPTKRA